MATQGPQVPNPAIPPVPEADSLVRCDKYMDRGVIFRSGDVAEVELVSHTSEPEQTLAILSRAYSQRYDTHITPDEVRQFTADLDKTRLQTPLESIVFTFLLRNVTRAFTHQIVRYRIGTSFVQESMRFYRHDTVPVRIPNAFALPERASALETYCRDVLNVVASYHAFLDQGLHRQDARGILPHDMLTNIFFTCSLRTLLHIYGQRTCCQIQHEEWPHVLKLMREWVEAVGLVGWLKTPWEMGRSQCGFGASYDQPCRWPERFGRVTTIRENVEPGEEHYAPPPANDDDRWRG